MGILVLTSFSGAEQVIPAIRAGADGYLLKDAGPEALDRRHPGGAPGRAPARPRGRGGGDGPGGGAARAARRPGRAAARCTPTSTGSRPAEREVLAGLGRGLSNRQLAAELFVSEKTVKTHVSSVLAKLRLADRTQAALFAVRVGLVDPRPLTPAAGRPAGRPRTPDRGKPVPGRWRAPRRSLRCRAGHDTEDATSAQDSSHHRGQPGPRAGAGRAPGRRRLEPRRRRPRPGRARAGPGGDRRRRARHGRRPRRATSTTRSTSPPWSAAAGGRVGFELLVNNAGTLGPTPLPPVAELRAADLERVLRTNVVAPLRIVQAALPRLRAEHGAIVNITSDAAVEGYEGWGGYGASKAALEQLSRVLAAEEPAAAGLLGRPRRHAHPDAPGRLPGRGHLRPPAARDPGAGPAQAARERPPSGRYQVEQLLAPRPTTPATRTRPTPPQR